MTEEETLKRIEKLLAHNLVNDMDEMEAIAILYKVGYNSTEIGEYLGKSPSTVRDRFGDLRSQGVIE